MTITPNTSKSALVDGDRIWLLAVHLVSADAPPDDAVARLVSEADDRADTLQCAQELGEAELRRQPPNVRVVLRALDLVEDAAGRVRGR